jgi:hypothetical protein
MPPATLNLCLKLLSALADGLMLVFEHPAMLTEFYPVMPEDAPFKQQDGALLAFALGTYGLRTATSCGSRRIL